MDVSIIISFRGDPNHPARHANLLAVARWLDSCVDAELIVVEQDTYPRLTDDLPHRRARTVFAYNSGPFNKSWGLNVGARIAQGSVHVFSDGDLVIDQGLQEAIELCRKGFSLAKPYRRLIDLSENQSTQYWRGEAPSLDPDTAAAGRHTLGERLPLCGGTFAIRADAFWALGGWDERFVGWGGEDDALSFKVERRRLSAAEVDTGVAMHLWHPRDPQSARLQPGYARNLQLLQSYRRLKSDAFNRLCDVQRQLAGNRDKYRPEEDA